MTEPKKEFSVMKWVFFPALTLALGLIVAFVNLKVFGWDNGFVYVVLLGVIVCFSIAINRYTGSENKKLAFAAFLCEIFLVCSLIANAGYSLYVMRNMVIADHATEESKATLDTISRLKSRRAQDRAVTKMGEIKSSAQTFKEHEFYLLCLFIAECLIYAISLFVLVGLAQIWPSPVERKQIQERKPDENEERNPRYSLGMSDVRGTDGNVRRMRMPVRDDDKADVDYERWNAKGLTPAQASIKAPEKRANLTTGLPPNEQPDTDKNASHDAGLPPDDGPWFPPSQGKDGMTILREVLAEMSFERGRGQWYRAENRKTHIRVRLMTRTGNDGAEKPIGTARLKPVVLDDAVKLPRAIFRGKLERSLARKIPT